MFLLKLASCATKTLQNLMVLKGEHMRILHTGMLYSMQLYFTLKLNIVPYNFCFNRLYLSIFVSIGWSTRICLIRYLQKLFVF